MIRLLVGMPAYRRHVDVGHLYQMMQLASECSRGVVRLQGFIDVDSCFVDLARNKIVKAALDGGAHWLLMCDHDTWFADPKAITRMVREAHESGAAVIGAPYKQRNQEHLYNVVKDGERVPSFGSVIEVDRLGTGFMAVNLGWLHEHWPKQPWFWTETLEGDEPSKRSEDYSFCDGVRKRGGVILCDGRFEPVHMTRL